MKLSVSSYSFAQYTRDGRMTLFDAIEKAAEIGFEGMEFIDLDKTVTEQDKRLELAGQVRAAVEKTGMKMVAYTIGANLWQKDPEARRAEIERLKREVDVAEALGAPLMRHDLVWQLDKTGAGRSFLGMIPQLAESVREISSYAETKGIRTCSENHGRIAQDSYRMEAFCAAVNHDNYGLLVDIGNFMGADEEPPVAVSRVANFAFHVHAKDNLIVPEQLAAALKLGGSRGQNYYVPCAIGDGSVPVKRCLSILKKAGYDGWVTLEYEGREDAVESIVKSYQRLKGYLAAL